MPHPSTAVRRASLIMAGSVLGLMVAGCGSSHNNSGYQAQAGQAVTRQAITVTAPVLGQTPSTIATARGSAVQVYPQPGTATPSLTLHSPNPDGARRVFLVEGGEPGWLHVLLPIQPNGSQGWIPAGQVTLTSTTYWIRVQRTKHRLQVFHGTSQLLGVPAAIGTQDTPTPGGLYYITELLKAPDPAGPYGPYAYGISGYSTSLKQFGGHLPIIGIHGTNQPQLIGTSVSHGCIRVNNTVITRMAAMLPLGTPVQITT